jgi:hypothetical protein
MSDYVYDIAVKQFCMNLRALKNVLTKARAFAKERNFDENSFLSMKAAPDMFNLLKQVQIATDSAKAAGGRLTSKPAPKFDDKETTLEELFSRIDQTINYLSSLKADDFSEFQKTKITFPWLPGKAIMGKDYFDSHAIPNFYFHLTATYMLLRQAGVPLGKMDFLGEQNWQNA